MCDDAFPLQSASDPHKASRHHLLAVLLERARPDNDIRDASIVFKGEENHPACRARPLAGDDKAYDSDPLPIRRIAKGGSFGEPADLRTEQPDRMIPKRQRVAT